jgi:hypothetical protein
MPQHRWTSDEAKAAYKAGAMARVAAREARSADLRAESQERVGAFIDRTPGVLMDAFLAGFSREGCTPIQSKLIHNNLVAHIYDAPTPIVDLLAASLDASRRGG